MGAITGNAPKLKLALIPPAVFLVAVACPIKLATRKVLPGTIKLALLPSTANAKAYYPGDKPIPLIRATSLIVALVIEAIPKSATRLFLIHSNRLFFLQFDELDYKDLNHSYSKF